MAGRSAMVEMLSVDGGESNLGWHFGAWNWSSSLGLAEEVLGSTIQGGFDHSFGYGTGDVAVLVVRSWCGCQYHRLVKSQKTVERGSRKEEDKCGPVKRGCKGRPEERVKP